MPLSEVNTPRAYIRQLAQFSNFRRPSEIAFLITAFFIYALVPYVYVVGLYQLRRKRAVFPSRLQRNLILLHVAGIGLFLAIAHGPRHFRLCTVAPPAILILVWLLTLPIPALGYIRKLSWIVAHTPRTNRHRPTGIGTRSPGVYLLTSSYPGAHRWRRSCRAHPSLRLRQLQPGQCFFPETVSI
jgi:hypothetical protein